MAKQYSAEFKMEAVRRIERTGETVSKVAADLSVNEIFAEMVLQDVDLMAADLGVNEITMSG